MVVVSNHDRKREQAVRILAIKFLQQALKKVWSLIGANAHTDMLRFVGHRSKRQRGISNVSRSRLSKTVPVRARCYRELSFLFLSSIPGGHDKAGCNRGIPN